MRDWRSTFARTANSRFGPPAGFGYPHGGLRPPSPRRFYFTPAALLGFTLRSFLLSKGIQRLSARMSPHTVFPRRYSRRREAVGRPNGPRFLGFDPFESPWRPAWGWHAERWLLPWVFALLGLWRKPGPGFRPDSSHALSCDLPEGRWQAAPRSIDRLPLRSVRH